MWSAFGSRRKFPGLRDKCNRWFLLAEVSANLNFLVLEIRYRWSGGSTHDRLRNFVAGVGRVGKGLASFEFRRTSSSELQSPSLPRQICRGKKNVPRDSSRSRLLFSFRGKLDFIERMQQTWPIILTLIFDYSTIDYSNIFLVIRFAIFLWLMLTDSDLGSRVLSSACHVCFQECQECHPTVRDSCAIIVKLTQQHER